ncbi:porin family protein [Acidobacteria bacterium AB60]|nr:porin family protein [Acidobacteria bacterium AB60]
MAFKRSLIVLGFIAAFVSALNAQIQPAAYTASAKYVGVMPTTANPDWGCPGDSPVSCWDRHLYGFEAYAGVNNVWNRIGLEADARWLAWHGVQLPSGSLKEYTYGIGPNVRIYARPRYTISGNALVGIGSITIPKGYGPGDGSHFMFNPALQVEPRLTESLKLRVQYEYQIWPSFQGSRGTRGLTPNGLGVGLTYTFQAHY